MRRPRLVPEARHWSRLWSIRLAILSALLSAAEMSMPLWYGLIPENTFAILSTVTAVAAAVARVVVQETIPNDYYFDEPYLEVDYRRTGGYRDVPRGLGESDTRPTGPRPPPRR